jgi:hypothetical protein
MSSSSGGGIIDFTASPNPLINQKGSSNSKKKHKENNAEKMSEALA